MSYLTSLAILGAGIFSLSYWTGKAAKAAEAAQQVSDADFGKLAHSETGPVLVDFFATWCPPCKKLAPIVDDLAADYKGRMKVMKVDVDLEKQLRRDYGVKSFPTLVLLFTDKNGKRVFVTSVGYKSKAELSKWIDSVIGDKNATGTEAPKPR